MRKELKAAIVSWLLEHEHEWQRVNACVEAFRPYIYGPDGNHIIDGETVHKFIVAADKLLYPGRPL